MNNQEVIEEKYLEAVKGIKEEWLVKVNPHWYNYILSLPIDLQIAYLVVTFDNQVLNGGFHQYFLNGYGQFAKETIDILIKIGASKKADLLKKALVLVNYEQNTDTVFREKLLKRDIKLLFVEDELFEPLDQLDSQYYENENENLEQLMGNYFRNVLS